MNDDDEWIAFINREMRFRQKMLRFQIIGISIALATFIGFVIGIAMMYR